MQGGRKGIPAPPPTFLTGGAGAPPPPPPVPTPMACYIRSEVTYRRRHDLECSNLEIMWLEIINTGSSSMFVSVIYRPPDSTYNFFHYAEENIESICICMVWSAKCPFRTHPR